MRIFKKKITEIVHVVWKHMIIYLSYGVNIIKHQFDSHIDSFETLLNT